MNDEPETTEPADHILAKQIADAMGPCYVCGYAIGSRQLVKKDGDEYRHASCQPATIEPARRGRPAGKPKPKRRNFAAELASLQGRVAMANRILVKIAANSGAEHAEANASLIDVVVEMLNAE
jgi:hypothetical protein